MLLIVLAVGAGAGCTSDDDDGPASGTSPASTGSAPATSPATSAPRVVQLGGPGETNRVLEPDELDELAVPSYTEADVAFVHGMLAHHEQALTMVAMVEERAGRTDLPLFAKRIDVSQHDEIAQLERWLEARGEDRPGDHSEHIGGELMPGMLTDEELAQLEAASGTEFDQLFLQYMIRHHEGAVAMVEQLITNGVGGQESEIFQLAQHIELDQQVEIARMRQMLTELEP